MLDVLEDRVTPSTFFVTKTGDPRGALEPGSLRWAVAQANRPQNQGSTVSITPLIQGTITLHAGEIPIRTSLTIENDSGKPLTILQATPNARIFRVSANAKTAAVTLAGQGIATLTLSGGHVVNGNGGAILVDNPRCNLTLSDVNVVGNAAIQIVAPHRALGGNGGGIYSQGTVTLEESSVVGNSAIGNSGASGTAGGVYTDRGVTLVASHVDANSALDAGGLFNVLGNVNVLAGSTVNGNTSSANSFANGELGGGGVGEGIGSVTVSDSQVSHNKTVGMYSGGIVSLLGGVSILDGSQIDDNSNNGPGGGIAANFEGAVTVSGHSQVDGNTSTGLGGGIVNFSERFGINILDGSEVDGNVLTNSETGAVIGGFIMAASDLAILSPGRGDPLLTFALKQFVQAIDERAAAIESAASAVPDGKQAAVGGGIASALTGPIVVSGGSQVNDNFVGKVVVTPATPGVGGGIFANQGSITIDNGAVDDNTATGNGGGIWNGSSLSINQSDVSGNHAGAPGGGIFNRGSFTTVNSTVVDNSPDDVFPTS